ncbi:expressed unknown protein [Seminavis robusta]|uniref:Uncharacterized protein n=1 Tax=Seminavis robusta TaxID=568900 RepID=A0A9N8HQB0_9STRA|nr:expressed unknown protein [Seminavis robusta]|eukprot:Sro1177_g249340.1 n/a (630) ;mRNA; f:4482-6463
MAFMDDNDFYRLLSAAVERDASFGDEELLKTPLEEGRIYNNTKTEGETDEFTKAIRILRDSRRINLSWFRLFWRRRRSLVPKNVAITPTILSGLCGYASKRRVHDNKRQQLLLQQQQQQAVTASGQAAVVEGNKKKNKVVTVTSSDLLRYCQGCRSQAIQKVRRKKRRKRFLLFMTPVIALFSLTAFVVKRMSRVLDEMENLKDTDEWLCSTLPQPSVQQTCHFVDTTAFHVLYNDGFQSDELATDALVCNVPQQTDPEIRICNPSKYSMHLQLINETLTMDQVMGIKPVPFQSQITREELYAQETVVNQIVRQSIEQFAENFDSAQNNKAVLDVGAGFGASLYSILPLMGQYHVQPTPTTRPRRRQAKPPMLHYTGFTLGPLEVARAKDLAASYLQGMEEVVNASFAFGNLVSDQPLPQLKVKQSYDVILAIESLSFAEEKKLKPLLHAMFGALRKGGILILVDDIVLPKDPTDPGFHNSQLKVNLFRQALMRPSILSHEQWVELFRATGFKMLEARELTLEFELLPDHIDVSLPRTESNILFSYTAVRVWRFLLDTYQKLMLRSLLVLRYVLQRRGDQDEIWGKKLGAWLRMVLLSHSATSTQRANSLRKGAYENADLSYNLYVLKR